MTMSFPPGSATAAAFEIACGSEPILVTFSPVFPRNRLVVVAPGDALPQPAARSAAPTPRTAASALAANPDPPEDAVAGRVRRPARGDRAALAVGHPARSAEARPADAGHLPAADVGARQVLELQRRRLERLRRDEQVGADEQLLRRLRLADEGDDLLQARPVPDHRAGELF